MIHTIREGVIADLSRTGQGGVRITFADLEYLRSDTIIFDRKDSSLYAVLHESSHYIGPVKADMAALFVENKDVMLAAAHYNGGIVDLKTPLVVSE